MYSDFYNDLTYTVKSCNIYKRWKRIIENVKSGKFTCCDDWKNFTVFHDYFLLNSSNKLKFMHVSDNHYSPDTCDFSHERQGKPNPKGGNKAKEMIVVSPLFDVFTVKNRAEFCRIHNLNYLGFNNMLRKKTNNYKGWKINYFS